MGPEVIADEKKPSDQDKDKAENTTPSAKVKPINTKVKLQNTKAKPKPELVGTRGTSNTLKVKGQMKEVNVMTLQKPPKDLGEVENNVLKKRNKELDMKASTK